MRDLDNKRILFEQKWQILRDSLYREGGGSPKTSRWIWLFAAAAGGLAAAWGLKRGKTLLSPNREE